MCISDHAKTISDQNVDPATYRHNLFQAAGISVAAAERAELNSVFEYPCNEPIVAAFPQ